MLTVRIPGTYVEALVAGQAVHFFVHNPPTLFSDTTSRESSTKRKYWR